MEFVIIGIVLIAVFSVLSFYLLGMKGYWRLLSLLPLLAVGLFSAYLWVQRASTFGLSRFGYDLLFLLFVLPAVAGIALGAVIRGIIAFLSWIGNR